ncbi:MAG: hypothetical protein L0K62_00120 [Lactobacillus sp.]|nr:hypothetical protein [Lactobacillus sp.]MDN6663158.1 hypothetical protein [Tetragenococcus koreensis]
MIFKQPNGLYGRVSTIVEAPTHRNMSKRECFEYLDDTDQVDFKGQTLENWMDKYGVDFEEAAKSISTQNMRRKEIDDWLKEVQE